MDRSEGRHELEDIDIRPALAKQGREEGMSTSAFDIKDVEKGNDGEKGSPCRTSVQYEDAEAPAIEVMAPPPDGGVQAWLQVLYGHLAVVASWGIINSAGAFTPYYVQSLNRSVADVNWIASIQICLLFFVGIVSGRLTDAGHFRPVFLAGSVLIVAGLFGASFSTTYWQFMLSQGLACGLGNGLQFTSIITVASNYFSTRRSLAMGLVACGSSTGGLVFPAITRQLLPSIGFGWTMRIIGFLVVGCLLVANLGLKPRLPPRKLGPLVEFSALKEPPFALFIIGMFLNFTGLYQIFFNAGIFAKNVVGATSQQQQVAVILLAAMGIHSRIIGNYVADRFTGPLFLLIPVSFVCGVVVLCFNAVHSYPGLLGAVSVYGQAGSSLQALFPAVLVSLTSDRSKTGARTGLCFAFLSVATLIGSPIAGVIIDAQGGRFTGANAFAGCCLLAGSAALLASRVSKVGWDPKARM